MSFIVRRAKLFDIARINAIEKEAFPTPWSFDALFSDIFLNSSTVYFSAVCDNAVIGYGGMWLIMDEAHITNVAVKREHRNRGVATSIMNELIGAAARHGMLSISLEVRRSNAIAKRLYESLGFYVDGERPGYYSNPVEDALLMIKTL